MEKMGKYSPDSTLVVFSKNFNLFWMDKENFLKAVVNENDSTIVENQWTQDGEKHFITQLALAGTMVKMKIQKEKE